MTEEMPGRGGSEEGVRAALASLLADPPPELLRLVRRRCGAHAPAREEIRRALARLTVSDPAGVSRSRPELLEAYREIERFCLALAPDAVDTRLWQGALTVSFLKGARRFCDVSLNAATMRVRLPGAVERALRSVDDVAGTKPLIRQAFEAA